MGLLPALSRGQQNLFNVPSADITEEGHFFFQQQFNFFIGPSGSSNTTLDYGLGHELEVGINLFNVDMGETNGEIQNPFMLLNFQKGFTLSENYKISFGTQTGVTPPIYHGLTEVPSFSYIDNAVDLKHWGKYYLGGYYADSAYAGRNAVGVMAGVDYPLLENRFHLMGDLIAGNTSISVAVLGAVVYLPNKWQLSLGAQLPAPSTNNDYGLVFEITKL
ncbi:MAG: hypothetical protein PHR16_06920 [Methylovulum sp.]|nr:hypothetical protein [Methylovulum sp.]